MPKAKLSQLLKILEIRNEDFGLSGSKSLKNFISASGFLGSSMAPWSDAMIDFLENTETNFVTQSLSDDENDDENSSADTQGELYQDLLRILRLYRVQKQKSQLSLVEKLDLLDSLSEGDEESLTQMLVALNIDPQAAYQAIESHLMDQSRQVVVNKLGPIGKCIDLTALLSKARTAKGARLRWAHRRLSWIALTFDLPAQSLSRMVPPPSTDPSAFK